MRKNIKNKTITPFAHKAVLIPLGLFLAVIILEVGLRLGGFIFLSLQEHRNKVSIQRKDTYRIMCLGESTTAGQYPIFLQEELDKYNTGIEFSVIDKGVVGVDTSFILDKLVSNIDTYNPDMVITMMGSNDIKYPHIPYGVITTEDEQPFLNSIRIYKLARLLWRDIVVMVRKQNTAKDKVQTSFKKNTSQKQEPANQPAESGPQKNSAHIEQGLFYQDKGQLVQAEDSFKKAIELNPNSDQAYSELGWFYRKQNKPIKAEDLFKKAISLNPKNDSAYNGLGQLYREQNKLTEAEDSFKKAIEINPNSDWICMELGWLYQSQSKFIQTENLFKKAIQINPQNDQAYGELGQLYQDWHKDIKAEDSYKKAISLNAKNYKASVMLAILYQNQGKFTQCEDLLKTAILIKPENDYAYTELGRVYQSWGKYIEAEDLYKKAIELKPNSDWAYSELGWFYQSQGKFTQVEDLFKKAISLNLKNDSAYTGLGQLYREQNKLIEAEDSYKKAIQLNPQNDWAYASLESIYMETGDLELARQYGKKANELRLSYYAPTSAGNYHKLKDTLDKRGITYVCVQYPVRGIEPLKKIFQGDEEGIIFVDNERIFKDALIQGEYTDYFIDSFGGDFGHCTDKGNRLLAENIANTISKEVFGR